MGACANAFYKHGDVSVHCRLLAERGERFTHCGLQHFCSVTKRWEPTDEARRCRLKESAQSNRTV